jgi:hypothetical protein
MHSIEKRTVYVIRSDVDASRHYVRITNDQVSSAAGQVPASFSPDDMAPRVLRAQCNERMATWWTAAIT